MFMYMRIIFSTVQHRQNCHIIYKHHQYCSLLFSINRVYKLVLHHKQTNCDSILSFIRALFGLMQQSVTNEI